MQKAFPREEFDAERDFVVTRGFVFNGKALVAGSHFDKSTATVRRLQQLFNQRMLRMLEESPYVNGEPKNKKAPKTEEAPRRRRLATAG